MKETAARNLVASLWAALFVLALAIPLWMYSGGWLGEEWRDKILTQINRSYVPYVGAMVSFYFASKIGSQQKRIAITPTVVAVLCTLIWNGLNLYFLLSLWQAKIEADAAINGMDKYSALLSWIVAPGMGFFFGSRFTAKGTKLSEKGEGAQAARAGGS